MSDDNAAELARVGTPQSQPEQDPAMQAPALQDLTPEPNRNVDNAGNRDIEDKSDKAKPVKSIVSSLKASLTAKWHAFVPNIEYAWTLWVTTLKYVSFLLVMTLLVDLVVVGIMGMPDSSQQDYFIVDNALRDTIDFKRGELLELRLLQRSFEEHPQCLARAITVAHNYYDDLPYQTIQEIVDDTVWWANDECKRLMFTPAVPATGWYQMFRVLTDKAGSKLHQYRKAFGSLFGFKKSRTPKKMESGPLVHPLGYKIQCNDKAGAICRLSSTVTPSISRINDLVGQVDDTSKDGRRSCPVVNKLRILQAIDMLQTCWWTVSLAKIGNALAQGNFSGVLKAALGTSSVYIAGRNFISFYFWYQEYYSRNTIATLAMNDIMVLVSWVLLIILLWRSRFNIVPGFSRALDYLSGSLFEGHDDIVKEAASDDEPDGASKTASEASETDSDTASSRPIQIDPNAPFHEDVKKMREHLHGKQAAVESRPESPNSNGSIANNIEDDDTPGSSESEASWTIIPEAETAVKVEAEKIGKTKEAAEAANSDEEEAKRKTEEDKRKANKEIERMIEESERAEKEELECERHNVDAMIQRYEHQGNIFRDNGSDQEDHIGASHVNREIPPSSIKTPQYVLAAKCSVCGIWGGGRDFLRCRNDECALGWAHVNCVTVKEDDESGTMENAMPACPMCGEACCPVGLEV